MDPRIRVHAARDHVARLGADEAGMVTVEAAYAIAAIVVTVVLAVGAVGGVTAQIRCTDAAREAARLSAIGESSAKQVSAQLVGDGAQISISEDAERVTAEVSTTVPLLPGLSVSARAVAAKEPRAEDAVSFAPWVEP